MKAGALALVLGAGLCLPFAATALEYKEVKGPQGRILMVTGDFKMNDDKDFATVLDNAGQFDEVWFSSPGGKVDASFKIGRLLRRKGMMTRIPAGASCASACSIAFIGGVVRSVDRGGMFGVHMATLTRDPERISRFIKEIEENGAKTAGKLLRDIEQSAAFTAAGLAKYLVEMGASLELMTLVVNTESDTMHWLTADELRRYNVVNQ
jgi:hypothetical protein